MRWEMPPSAAPSAGWAATGEIRDISYAELARLSNRFANLLCNLGVKRGERLFSLSGRIPELYIAALGTLKAGCVFSPLFSAFGPEPVQARLSIARAGVLLTTPMLYQRKVAPIRAELPHLKQVLLIGAPEEVAAIPETLDLHRLLAAADERFEIVNTAPEDSALLHFTSGTTGKPKGAVHVHQAVLAHRISAQFALDLRPDDLFWCTADPGWVTGTSYGIIAPLAVGATLLVDEEEFNGERWCRILQDQQVNVWYTAPTAIRLLMRLGLEFVRRFDYSNLRLAASVGEPLNPDAVLWGQQAFGLPFRDTWWQTETGAIMIANALDTELKPGSMGRPLPGIEAAVVQRGQGWPGTVAGTRSDRRTGLTDRLAIHVSRLLGTAAALCSMFCRWLVFER